MPMEVPADHVHEAMLENPMIGDFLDQARDKGRQNIIEVRIEHLLFAGR